MAVTLPAPQQQQLPGAVSQLALARTTSDAGLPAAAAAAAAAAGLAEMEDDVAQQAGSDQAPRSSSSSAVADAAKRQLSLLGASSSGLVPCKAPGGCPHGLAGRLQAQQAGQEQQAGPATHMLQNKPPHWNEGLRCWCLNFRCAAHCSCAGICCVCARALPRICAAARVPPMHASPAWAHPLLLTPCVLLLRSCLLLLLLPPGGACGWRASKTSS